MVNMKIREFTPARRIYNFCIAAKLRRRLF